MVEWSWKNASKGAAAGSAGFASGNPIVGAITTLGGGLIGGLMGGGKDNPGAYSPPYQVPPGTNDIGGSVWVPNMVTTDPGSMSNGDLLAAIARGEVQVPPELKAQLDAYQAKYGEADREWKELIEQRDRGQISEAQFRAAMEGWVERYGMTPRDMALENQFPELMTQLRDAAQGQEVERGGQNAPVANILGMGDVGAGNQLLEAGLTMEGRDPTALSTTQVNNERRRMGESRGMAIDAAAQIGADREALLAAANADRANMGAALGSGNALWANQLAQGQDQLDYMRAVQRGEAGPSLAEVMSNRLLAEQVNDQMAMAKSGAGFNPAAQRQAAITGGAMADAQRQQLMEMRAAEQMAAQGQTAQLLGQQANTAGNAATYGFQGANQLGQFGLGANEAAAGLSAQQQAAAAQLYGQDQSRAGMEMGWATTEAQLSESQKARDDAMRQYLSSLGMDVRGQGYGLLTDQAKLNLGAAQVNAGAQNNAANLGYDYYTYDQNRRDAANDRAWETGGTVLRGLSQSGAFNNKEKPQQQNPLAGATDPYTDQPDVTYDPNSGTASDERTKQELSDARQQIDSLLRALSQQSPEQQLATAGGQRPPMTQGQRELSGQIDSEINRTLAGLAGVEAPSWRYTDEAREVMPDKTSPGQHIGYTTKQLKAAGPAGQAMVRKDPTSGYEYLDGPSTQSFTLAAIGEQEREIQQLQKKLKELEDPSVASFPREY